MATQNPISAAHAMDPGSDPAHVNPGESLTDEEWERIRESYRAMNFKGFLAACPIDGIDLTWEFEYPREAEL